MPGYSTCVTTLRFDGRALRIRALADTQQFADPDRLAANAAVSDEQWSHFGQVWPSGRLLADAVLRYPLDGKRILEIGCGLGLPSLVLQRRGLDVTATDHHPLTETFLAYNAGLNDMPALPYRTFDWRQGCPGLGRFDVILASDVLYEPGQAALVAGVVREHAQPEALVLVSDPNRGFCGTLTRALREQGFDFVERTERRAANGAREPRLLEYTRARADGRRVAS